MTPQKKQKWEHLPTRSLGVHYPDTKPSWIEMENAYHFKFILRQGLIYTRLASNLLCSHSSPWTPNLFYLSSAGLQVCENIPGYTIYKFPNKIWGGWIKSMLYHESWERSSRFCASKQHAWPLMFCFSVLWLVTGIEPLALHTLNKICLYVIPSWFLCPLSPWELNGTFYHSRCWECK